MVFTRSTANQSSDTSALHRALEGYDREHENVLVKRIIDSIAQASLVDDGAGNRVLALRLGEIASALTTCLASTLALSPAVTRSPAAVREIAERVRKKLTQQVRQAERDPEIFNFKNRTFNDSDRDRGGNA